MTFDGVASVSGLGASRMPAAAGRGWQRDRGRGMGESRDPRDGVMRGCGGLPMRFAGETGALERGHRLRPFSISAADSTTTRSSRI